MDVNWWGNVHSETADAFSGPQTEPESCLRGRVLRKFANPSPTWRPPTCRKLETTGTATTQRPNRRPGCTWFGGADSGRTVLHLRPQASAIACGGTGFGGKQSIALTAHHHHLAFHGLHLLLSRFQLAGFVHVVPGRTGALGERYVQMFKGAHGAARALHRRMCRWSPATTTPLTSTSERIVDDVPGRCAAERVVPSRWSNGPGRPGAQPPSRFLRTAATSGSSAS